MKWKTIVTSNSEKNCFNWLDEYLNSKQQNSELEQISIEDPSQLISIVEEQKKNAESIRFASDLYEDAAKLYETNPIQTLTLKVGDCLKYTDSSWWLRSYTFQALNQLISKHGTHVNLDGDVLIIGEGGFARLCASAFIRIGFKRVNISSLNHELVTKLAKDLERTYFGVKSKAIPSEELILLPGTHTIMVNTLKETDETANLLTDLYYFNFLKQGGMVWDLNFLAVESALTKEANDVGAYTLNGVELTALSDALWLKDNFAIDIDLKNYEEYLISKIS